MSYLGTTKIGKMYLGATKITKAYLGSTRVFSLGSGPVPSSVPYVRNAPGAYIDTGITADGTTRVIVWARNFNPYCGSLFGSCGSGGSQAMQVTAANGVNTGAIRYDCGSSQAFHFDAYAKMSGYHKYEFNGNMFLIDDKTIGTASGTLSSDNGRNIHLFGRNNNGNHENTNTPIDICACKIYKGDVLVRDFTAVSSPGIGLFDSVSDTLFTASGTGGLTYGTFNPNAYTPLEYVECDGHQWFDSGAYGTYDQSIVCAFMPTNSVAQWTDILGERLNDNSCDIALGSATAGQDNKYVYFRLGNNQTPTAAMNNFSLTFKLSVALKELATLYVYQNNVQKGRAVKSGVSSSFTTTYTMGVGSLVQGNSGGVNTFGEFPYIGRFYYVGFGDQRSFVPAMVAGVAGMYDTYNDMFYASISGTNFIAGPSVARPHFLVGRKVTIIGDSISTYDADGYKYDSYLTYYPASDVTDVSMTWWKRLLDEESATLEENLSYSGSNASTRTGFPTLYDRSGLIGNPDVVIIALGTNDSNTSVDLGNYSYDAAIADLDESKFREAYIKGIKGILATKPGVTIVCAIFYMTADYRNSIMEIAAHYGFRCVDCGNGYDLFNQVHPTAKGMQQAENCFLIA